MSNLTNESEDGLHYKDQAGSLLIDEADESNAGGAVLKKGPWTSAEDAILVDYVKKHGEGNWNAVQKDSGLSRCGKSCRLRWANHLRPNLKKGAFTPDEEKLIIELHAKMGNKWARMAAHLPGRTDNEIKNYWNTRIKRRQRAGLPLYPPEMCSQVVRPRQEGKEIGGIDNGEEDYDLWKVSHDILPEAIFDRYSVNQELLPYASEPLKISPSNMLIKGYASSQYCGFMTPTAHHQKRMRESTSLCPTSDECVKSTVDSFMYYAAYNKTAQSVDSYLSFDPDPDPASKRTMSPGVIQGDHSLSNGNSSASKPHTGEEKLELPSLQFAKTDLGSWEMAPLPPIPESVSAYIQFPSSNSVIGSDCSSQCNGGLLDSLLYETSNFFGAVKDHSSESNLSTLSHGNVIHGSNLNVYVAPLIPFEQSGAPLFTEHTPISSSGSSIEEIPLAEAFADSIVTTEELNQALLLEREEEVKIGLNISQPDALVSSDWLDDEFLNDASIMTDVVALLVEDDLVADYENMDAGTSTSNSGWGLGSCAWNNMPPVCQTTDLPQ